MRAVRGWICDGCREFSTFQPWLCAGCSKEICDNCGWAYGHCKNCAGTRSFLSLATAANATGNFDFELEGLTDTGGLDGAVLSGGLV